MTWAFFVVVFLTSGPYFLHKLDVLISFNIPNATAALISTEQPRAKWPRLPFRLPDTFRARIFPIRESLSYLSGAEIPSPASSSARPAPPAASAVPLSPRSRNTELCWGGRCRCPCAGAHPCVEHWLPQIDVRCVSTRAKSRLSAFLSPLPQ